MKMPTRNQSINQAINQWRFDGRKEWIPERLLWSIKLIVFSQNYTCDSAFFFRDWTLFRTNPSPGLTYQKPTYLEQLSLFADPTSQSTNQPLQSLLNITPLWIFFLRAKDERKCEGMFVSFIIPLCDFIEQRSSLCARTERKNTVTYPSFSHWCTQKIREC